MEGKKEEREEKSLSAILDPAIIDLNVEGTTKDEVLRHLAGDLLQNGYIDSIDQFVSDIYEREAEGPTGMGEGISIPHGHSSAAKKIGIAIGKTLNPIPWESDVTDDGTQETTMIFLFCVPANGDFIANHQMLLSQLATKLGCDARIAKLPTCQTVEEIVETLLCDDDELDAVGSKEEIVELDIGFDIR